MVKVQTYKPGPTLITRACRYLGIKFSAKRMYMYSRYNAEHDLIECTSSVEWRFGIRVFKDRIELKPVPEERQQRSEYLKYKGQLKRSGRTERFLMAKR